MTERKIRCLRRNLAVAAGALVCVAVASHATALGGSPPTIKSMLEMRREGVVVQQWDLSCGAAALATLLNYQHDDPVTEREIASGLIARGEYLANPQIVRYRQGFSFLDLKRYVEARGYLGAGYGRLTLEQLEALAPAITPVDFNGYRHFVIFRGVRGNRVLLADPAYGNRTMPVRRFIREWIDDAALGRVAFIVRRADGAPAPGKLLSAKESDFVMLQ